MRMLLRLVRSLLTVSLLTIFGAGIAFSQGINESAVLSAAEAQRAVQVVEFQSAEIERLAHNGQTDTLVVMLSGALNNASLADAPRERLLYEGAVALAMLKPNARTRSFVASLTTYKSKAYVWHEESRHRTPLPMYAVSAAAKFCQATWQSRSVYTETLKNLSRGSSQFIDELHKSDSLGTRDPRYLGVLRALNDAPIPQIAIHRDALRTALVERELGGPAFVVAKRLADDALYRDVIIYADSATALSAVTQVDTNFGVHRSLSLLDQATGRDDVASAAYYRIGALAQDSTTARRLLLTRLSDAKHGGSAAASLARLQSAEIAAELGRIAADPPDELTQRRALLALRLDDSTAAQRSLTSFLTSDKVSPELREEARSW